MSHELQIVPLTPSFGAEVRGITLDHAPDDATVAAVRAALLAYKVVFLRGQSFDPSSLRALATHFGEPTPAHPVEPSVPGHPDVLSLDSDEGARADVWHSDLTYQERPPLGAFLHAEVVPDVGGDTMWVDTALAFASLSAPLRAFLCGLTATHTPEKAGGYFADRGGAEAAAENALTAHRHPVVRVHPETGVPALFVNPLFTDKIDGLRRAESDALLALIQSVAVRPETMVRWRWQAGDLAFWDNRCTMHYALLDYGTDKRRMVRVALEGDVPVGVEPSP